MSISEIKNTHLRRLSMIVFMIISPLFACFYIVLSIYEFYKQVFEGFYCLWKKDNN